MKYRELHTKDYPALKQMLINLQDFFISINDEYRKFSDATAEEYLYQKYGFRVSSLEFKLQLTKADARNL